MVRVPLSAGDAQDQESNAARCAMGPEILENLGKLALHMHAEHDRAPRGVVAEPERRARGRDAPCRMYRLQH